MQTLEDFKKTATDRAFAEVYAWKQEHCETYSNFALDMMKVMHNDFDCIEHVFKMAVRYIPLPVLVECQKLFSSTVKETDESEDLLETTNNVIDDLMALKGYMTIAVSREDVEDESFLVREFGLSDVDCSETDESRCYLPLEAEEDFWDSLPSVIQFIVFNLAKGKTAEELSELIERIMIAASWTLPKVYCQIHEDIHERKNSLLMCALYYIMYDHGFHKLALALGKTSLSDKHKTYVREGIKTVIDKAVETSIRLAYDKKSEWKETGKGIEDKELQQVINATLATTKGKHGRPILEKQTHNLDDYLIGDKDALKKEILHFINDMERIYDLAHLWFVLKETKHLTDILYPTFHHAIEKFTDRKFNPDRASRLAIKLSNKTDREDFWRRKTSSSVQSKKIVTYWTKAFCMIH